MQSNNNDNLTAQSYGPPPSYTFNGICNGNYSDFNVNQCQPNWGNPAPANMPNAPLQNFSYYQPTLLNPAAISIKVKKLNPEANVLPSNSRATDAGYDVVAVDDGKWSEDGKYIEYGTGIAVELPPGYHLKVAPRSSNSKYDLLLCNSEGLIDNEYRGEIKLRFKYVPAIWIKPEEGSMDEQICLNDMGFPSIYKKGNRIAQLKVEKTIYAEFSWADELSETSRAEGGFGSTGR